MKRKNALLIREIREYLDENLYKEHTILDLCRQFTINREKLQAGFYAIVHSTVNAYIVRERIERAARQLLISDNSIKAVAFNSGYKKQRSFNKTFTAFLTLLLLHTVNCTTTARNPTPSYSPLLNLTNSKPICASSKPIILVMHAPSFITCTQYKPYS